MNSINHSPSSARLQKKKIPAGDLAVKVTGAPNGETFMRLEQPRGERDCPDCNTPGEMKKSGSEFYINTMKIESFRE